jgi:hypothetical protein
VYEPFLVVGLGGVIGLSRDSDEPIVVHIYPQRVEARHTDVDTKIVLEALDQVRTLNVLTDYSSSLFVDLFLCAYNSNPLPAGGVRRLDDPLPIWMLSSLKVEPLVILRHYISCRTEVVLMSKQALHTRYVSPEIVLTTKLPASWEMTSFLVLTEAL